jgi:hypothetical protein
VRDKVCAEYFHLHTNSGVFASYPLFSYVAVPREKTKRTDKASPRKFPHFLSSPHTHRRRPSSQPLTIAGCRPPTPPRSSVANLPSPPSSTAHYDHILARTAMYDLHCLLRPASSSPQWREYAREAIIKWLLSYSMFMINVCFSC